ncbi:MAG TPA: TonB-dependent receptor [Vicinamibacterales bacterium]|nr:TonB-dependent receptor [Vicinamibacterales bacterium]
MLVPGKVHAQQTPPATAAPTASTPSPQTPPLTGTITGEVTTQNAAIALGAVQVVVFSGETRIANLLSEGDGSFKVENLPPGEYRVSALLDGFQPIAATVTVTAGQTVKVPLDLQLAESVTVTADTNSVVPPTGTLTTGDAVNREEMEVLAPGGGLQAALRLLVSVIQVPGGVAIKGGRPTQAAMQIGPGFFVDPATGNSLGTLPDDAIDSITVLPNPYAVEFGRFSSGLVLVQTRKATDQWKVRVNNLDPTFRTERGTLLHIIGLQSFYPRAEVGGPLIKDKLFLQQSFQYRFRANDIPSRPQDQLRTVHRFSSFTRLDANLSPNQTLTALAGIFPSTSKNATLGTFTPPDATVDLKNRVDTYAVTDRLIVSPTLISETTGEVNLYHTDVRPQGPDLMELVPDSTVGNFYNIQKRKTSTYQAVQTFTGTHEGGIGLHQYKFGGDVLFSRFDGSSDSRSVLIKRIDNTLARRLDFTPAGDQSIDSTDVALFAQDRWQPNNRWYVEFGARLDRDGVIDTFNVTPRVGTAVLLNQSGSAVIRTGYGLFYERTPSAAGVFEQYESATDTRYAGDGTTMVGEPQFFRNVRDPDLKTPRSGTWDVAYDHRFNPTWSIHAGAIDRRGSHELILDRVLTSTGPELRLSSAGRSTYRELELGVHFIGGPGADVNVSYVRSQARSDLNAFTNYYDSILSPVLAPNSYGPARADSPNRLLARGRMMPTPTWLMTGVLEWRSGLPYSIVDENLDYVGQRNGERFPTYFRLDLGIEHRFKIGSLRPWIGVRADNALNSFLPVDVFSNLASPRFGTFANSEYRQFRLQVRFER